MRFLLGAAIVLGVFFLIRAVVQVAYTYSKSVDTTSEATFVGTGDTNQNGPNSRFAKGLSRFHVPHRFTLNGSWRLQFFQGRRDVLGQPVEYRLVTNGFSMSGTGMMSDRYMKLFVYWPVAVHPRVERALPVLEARVGRQRDDRNAGTARIERLETSEQLVAVLARHLDVGEHHIGVGDAEIRRSGRDRCKLTALG